MEVKLVDNAMAERILRWALRKYDWESDWWCAFDRYYDVNVWFSENDEVSVTLYPWDQENNCVQTSKWQVLGKVKINRTKGDK
jgi:hypothetical protein